MERRSEMNYLKKDLNTGCNKFVIIILVIYNTSVNHKKMFLSHFITKIEIDIKFIGISKEKQMFFIRQQDSNYL